MELYYQGTNITEDVQIVEAKGTDASEGRCDSLELVFEEPGNWYQWKPGIDDGIELVRGGYSTGLMYVNTICPEEGRFRILATAEKTTARRKSNIVFEGKRLEDILKFCARENGMEWKLYGLDGGIAYPYLQRYEMGNGAFLQRIANMEGAVLKTYSGRYTMIGILEAQKLPAAETIKIRANQPGIRYQRRENMKLKQLTVRTPYARARATDYGAKKGAEATLCCLPAKDPATAGRWARGMLLSRNRRAEELTIECEFRESFTAMARIDIQGPTDASGEWLVDRAEHDYLNGTSRVTLVRCIETVK